MEIDGAGEDNENASTLLNIANRKHSLAYCKHDGSLDDGFEIVTHPMSLEYQLHEMPWDEVLREAIAQGYLSHQAGTCGLHVHVSRKAFGDTYDAQDSAIARVLFFVECHWRELLRFSRRTQRQMDQWAARYGYRDQPPRDAGACEKGRWKPVHLRQSDQLRYHRIPHVPWDAEIEYAPCHIADGRSHLRCGLLFVG